MVFQSVTLGVHYSDLVTRATRSVLLAVAVMLLPAPVHAQTAANVLVVANAASGPSVRIADAYARARLIPDDQVLRLAGLDASPADDIERSAFDRLIQLPIAKWLTAHAAQDRIVAIVLTKGVPLRIIGSGGAQGTMSSVDSELTLLYRRMTGIPVPIVGSVPNPYFLDTDPAIPATPFTHEQQDIYLVARLDGFTEDDVLGLIRRAQQPSKTGRFVLDQKSSWTDKGNDWLQLAADRLTKAGWGDRVVLESSSSVAMGQQHVLGYYSWGSNDPAIKVRHFDMQFEPGAIGGMFVSTDARTFKEPPANWQPGSGDNPATHFAGSHQSLAGDLIHDGITGVAGHVAEPYLRATIRPDVLFPAYVAGRTLSEAFYLAMPVLSWQTVVVGDPLCAPFQPRPVPAGSLDPGVDDTTEMPRWFSDRRLAQASRSGNDQRALRLMLRAETHLARDDQAGARSLLEQATSVDEGLIGPQVQLASMYELAGEYQKAIERYRKVLARKPDEVSALNNLAYGLAVRANVPAEGLPLAERAHRLAPDAPAISDTLGWILVLLGRSPEALPLLESAAKSAPQSAEIKLHLARAYADLGRAAEAKATLDKALALDQSLATSPEATRVRQMLK